MFDYSTLPLHTLLPSQIESAHQQLRNQNDDGSWGGTRIQVL